MKKLRIVEDSAVTSKNRSTKANLAESSFFSGGTGTDSAYITTKMLSALGRYLLIQSPPMKRPKCRGVTVIKTNFVHNFV